MVCDALADLVPYSSFEDTIERARERLHQVNDHLQRVSARSIVPTRTASTVVALLARAARCAVLWAGDSRAYRWRNGELVQLTRDHHLTQPEGGAGRPEPDSNVVTRAVGAMPTLTLDQCREEVRCGDRFLLCSDGLTRIIPDAQIGGWLEHADIRVAVEGLIKATLDAGAPDNVTALIVEAFV
jgi:serine/threonine protein phosphatase PrpC